MTALRITVPETPMCIAVAGWDAAVDRRIEFQNVPIVPLREGVHLAGVIPQAKRGPKS